MLFSSSLFLSSNLCRASASETRNVLRDCQQKVHVGYIREGLQMNFKYNDFSTHFNTFQMIVWNHFYPLRNARNHGFPEPNVGLKMAGPLEVHHCHESWGFSFTFSWGGITSLQIPEMVTEFSRKTPPSEFTLLDILIASKALQGRFILLQFVLTDLSCLTTALNTLKGFKRIQKVRCPRGCRAKILLRSANVRQIG